MLKHEYLACLELHRQIKEQVTGDVFITIDENDTLIVHITAYRHLRYKYEQKYISYEMIGGELNYDKIVRVIMHDYRDFILKKYFRR